MKNTLSSRDLIERIEDAKKELQKTAKEKNDQWREIKDNYYKNKRA
jgi:hypothetical protein